MIAVYLANGAVLTVEDGEMWHTTEGEVAIKDKDGVPVAQAADRAWFLVQKTTQEKLNKSLEGESDSDQQSKSGD